LLLQALAVNCADSALNEFTLENVTAALSANFTEAKTPAELRVLSYLTREGYLSH
jgi:hypothetical protein